MAETCPPSSPPSRLKFLAAMERASSPARMFKPASSDDPHSILLHAAWKLQMDWKLAFTTSSRHRVDPRLGLVGYLVSAYMGGLAIDFSTAFYLYCYYANQSPEWHAAMFSTLTSKEVRHAYAQIEKGELSDWHCMFDSVSWLEQGRRVDDMHWILDPLLPWAKQIAGHCPAVTSTSPHALSSPQNICQRTISLLFNVPRPASRTPAHALVKIRNSMPLSCLYVLPQEPFDYVAASQDPAHILFLDLEHSTSNVIKSASYNAKLPPTIIHHETSYIELSEFQKLDGLGFWMLPRFVTEIVKKYAKHINIQIISVFVRVLTSPKVLDSLLASLGYFDAEMASQSPRLPSHFRVLTAMSFIFSQATQPEVFYNWMVDTFLPLLRHLEARFEAYRLAEQMGYPWPPEHERLWFASSVSDTTLNNSSDELPGVDKNAEIVRPIPVWTKEHFPVVYSFIFGALLAMVVVHVTGQPTFASHFKFKDISHGSRL